MEFNVEKRIGTDEIRRKMGKCRENSKGIRVQKTENNGENRI